MVAINTDRLFTNDRLHSLAVRTGGMLAVATGKLLEPVFWILSWRSAQKIPSIDHNLFKLSAKKLSFMIRNREISSEEVITRYINRVIEVNKILNAVVDDRFQEALQEAKLIDEFLATTTLSMEEIEERFPLLGIPVTVKESCKLKGLSYSVGLKTRKGMIADGDGVAVSRVRAAGAIPLLVSNTPETCFGLECDNLISGVCSNPYNTNYTCGGSSGGEGALLGAACSVIGIGSDVGGSIRIPSLFNGIFGHKPTAELTSNYGHYPFVEDEHFSKFLVVGPMARYAEDLRLMLSIMVTKQDVDISEKVPMENVTVYYMEDIGDVYFMSSVDKSIREALLKCVEHLGGRCNSKVNETKFTELSDSLDMCVASFGGIGNKPDLMIDQNDPSIRYNFLSEGNHREAKINDFKRKFSETLGDYGVFLFPTLHTSAFQHKGSVANVTGIAYTMAFNVLGYPATHVPLGLNEKGLPIGIQVVANTNRDALCLSVAEELERRFGGWIPPA